MAPITAFDVGIDLQLRGLRTLKTLLTKAQSSPADIAKSLPTAKFSNDTATLAFHTQSCTNLATSGLDLLTHGEQETPVWSLTEGSTPTLEDLISRVDKTITQFETQVASLKLPDDLDGIEDKELQVTYGNGQKATWGGKGYILGYSIPNFMFHLCMVYSVLCSQGVETGKMDFLVPFMVGNAPGF